MKKHLTILGVLLLSRFLVFGQVTTSISPQTTDFTAKFTITPTHSPMDGAFALSNGAATGWNDFTTIILFSADKTIKVSDLNTFKKINAVTFEAGQSYDFIQTVNMSEKTYDVALIQSADTIILAKNFAFRKDPSGTLDYHVVNINELEAWGGVPGSNLAISNFEIVSFVELKYGESNGFGFNVPMETKDENFAMKFSIIPSHAPMDGLFVLTEGPTSSWDHLTSIILFASDQTIKVSDKNSYKKINAITYNASSQYDFIMNVNMDSMTYDVLLLQSTDTIVLGLNYAFRLNSDTLDNVAIVINELEAWGGVPGSTLEVLNKEIIEPLEINYGEQNDFAMNIPIKEQTEDFSVKFTAIPSHSPMDGLFVLADSSLENWNQISAGVRFSADSTIDVVDGSQFDTLTTFPYTAGGKYNFIMTMHMASNEYDVGVMKGEDTVILALGYNFRKQATSLNTRAVIINELEAWGGVPGSSIDIQNVEITAPIPLIIVPDTINSAPEMNSVSSKNININAGEVVIDLSGINDGDDGTQNITITAKSSDPSIVADPVINYSGGETATLTYTPLAVGTTTITIYMKDDGGTEYDGIDSAKIMFDIKVVTYKEALISFTFSAPEIDGVIDNNWSKAEQFDITSLVTGVVKDDQDFSGYWKASWDTDNLYILVDVVDDSLYDNNGNPAWNTDNIELYFQMDGIRTGGPASGVGAQFSLKWNKGVLDLGGADATLANTEWAQVDKGQGTGGYVAEFKFPWNSLKSGYTPLNDSSFSFDINVSDNEEGNEAYAATYWNSYRSLWSNISNAGIIKLTGYYPIGKATLEYTNIAPEIDGVIDESAWNISDEYDISIISNVDGVVDDSNDCSGSWRATWDMENFYVLVEVVDDKLWDNSGSPDWNTDNIEMYFQMENNRIGKGPKTDNGSQVSFKWNKETLDVAGGDAVSTGIEWKRVDNSNAKGYTLEVKFPWGSLKPAYTPANDTLFAFDISIIDNEETNVSYAAINWSSDNGLWKNIDKAGEIKLSGYFVPTETTIEYVSESPVIDGVADDALWESADTNICGNLLAGQVDDEYDASGYWKAVWDVDNLYMVVDVDDDILYDNNGNPDNETDNLEIYFQMDNNKDGTGPVDSNGIQVSFMWNKNGVDVLGGGTVANDIEWMRRDKGIGEGGYVIEIQIPWTSLKENYVPDSSKSFTCDVIIIDNEESNSGYAALGWSSDAHNLAENINKAGIVNLSGMPIVESIKFISSHGFSIYPNPTTSGNFVVTTGNNTKEGINIQVFDVTGKQVYSSLHTNEGTEMSKFYCNILLEKGIYIIKLSDNSGVYSEKLIVK